jgi:hypothetical protein
MTVPVTTDPRDLISEPCAHLARETSERDGTLGRRSDAGRIKLVGIEISLYVGRRRCSGIRSVLDRCNTRCLPHGNLDLRWATNPTRHHDIRFVALADVPPLGLMGTA